MVDLRVARPITMGRIRFVPQLDIFNIGNADTVVVRTNGLGNAYLTPTEILAPAHHPGRVQSRLLGRA